MATTMHRSERRASAALSRPSQRDPAAVAPPPVAARLRAMATRVRRLGLAGRFDLEAAYIERDEIAQALLRLAIEADRAVGSGAKHAPSVMAERDTPTVRRLLALLAARKAEADHLQVLLAQAAKPARRQRRTRSKGQLLLPLIGDRA